MPGGSHVLHNGQRALLASQVQCYIIARTSLCWASAVAGEGSLRWAMLRVAALRPSSVAIRASGLGRLLTSKQLRVRLDSSLYKLVMATIAKWKLAVRQEPHSLRRVAQK